MDEVNPGTLLNPILYETSVYNWKRYNSYTYDLMQCAVSTSSTNGVGWWYMTDSEGDGTWTTYYKWINNAKEMMRLTGKLPEASKQPNYDAISLTLQCWLYQILTDAFGDIPMSEACSALWCSRRFENRRYASLWHQSPPISEQYGYPL